MADERSYWLDLFTDQTWREFLNSGGSVSGFSAFRWNTVKRIKPKDYLLCYLRSGVLAARSSLRDPRMERMHLRCVLCEQLLTAGVRCPSDLCQQG